MHCHLPYRSLSSFKERSIEISKILNKINFTTKKIKINIGGGFNSLMKKEFWKKNNLEKAVTFKKYSEIISKNLHVGNDNVKKIELWTEPGTALISNALDYYCKVMSVKKIDGKLFANTSGSIYDIKPNSKSIILDIDSLIKKRKYINLKKYFLCGYTCIENDFLSKCFNGNLKEGDILKIKDVGSYSFSMKPNFIKPKPAVYLKDNKKYTLIQKEETLIQ